MRRQGSLITSAQQLIFHLNELKHFKNNGDQIQSSKSPCNSETSPEKQHTAFNPRIRPSQPRKKRQSSPTKNPPTCNERHRSLPQNGRSPYTRSNKPVDLYPGILGRRSS